MQRDAKNKCTLTNANKNPTKTNHPKTMPNKDYNEARELLRPQQKWTTRRIGAATEGEVAAKMIDVQKRW